MRKCKKTLKKIKNITVCLTKCDSCGMIFIIIIQEGKDFVMSFAATYLIDNIIIINALIIAISIISAACCADKFSKFGC